MSQATWMPKIFWPPTAAATIEDSREVQEGYAHFRPRILFWSTVGYGMFYFVRKNLSVAMPAMMAELHYSKPQLGMILTLHGVLYGISKFLNGVAADRANARVFMASALIVCAVLNIFFGMSTSLLFLGMFWMVNGWFQGMGYPPCARLLTHWFSPRELASKMAIWNISHSLGGASIVILSGYILYRTNNWRLCFYIPAVIALVTAAMLLINLRDTPESIGLPPVERTPMPPIRGLVFCSGLFVVMCGVAGAMYCLKKWDLAFCGIVTGITAAMMALILANLRDRPVSPDEPPAPAQAELPPAENPDDPSAPSEHFLWTHVFSNKYIWLVSIANFSVYTIRFAIFDWGPTLLHEYKGMPVVQAASVVAGFEIAGLFGMLATGWLTDRFFGGRGVPLCLVCMLLCALSIFLFWKEAGQNMWLNSGLLAAAGFFVYGPQALLAVVAANLATKKAAATAVGLTSIFGYASTVLSGWGLGTLAKAKGWEPAFACLIGIALIGAVLFALALPAKAHGYGDAK